jgi:hypothetical protein
VLEEQQPAARLQEAPDVLERRLHVRDRAERVGDDDRVDALGRQQRGFAAERARLDREQHLARALSRQREHGLVRIDRDHALDLGRVVEMEIAAGAGADLEHTAGRIGHDTRALARDGAASAREIEQMRQDMAFVESHRTGPRAAVRNPGRVRPVRDGHCLHDRPLTAAPARAM